MEIKDKVIIVTGASQGIGLATAKHLTKLGAKVVLVARNEGIIKKVESELKDSLAVVTDVTEDEDIEELISETMKKYGRIDVLVNNAGQGMYGPVEKINIEDYRQIMELNVFAVLKMMQKVIPIMRKQGKGIIVNISSGVAKRYLAEVGAYSSTKYALNALSFISRQELAKDNISVCTVSPKITKSNFAMNALGKRPEWIIKMLNMPMDSCEKVAEKIAESIESEKEEIEL